VAQIERGEQVGIIHAIRAKSNDRMNVPVLGTEKQAPRASRAT